MVTYVQSLHDPPAENSIDIDDNSNHDRPDDGNKRNVLIPSWWSVSYHTHVDGHLDEKYTDEWNFLAILRDQKELLGTKQWGFCERGTFTIASTASTAVPKGSVNDWSVWWVDRNAVSRFCACVVWHRRLNFLCAQKSRHILLKEMSTFLLIDSLSTHTSFSLVHFIL